MDDILRDFYRICLKRGYMPVPLWLGRKTTMVKICLN